MMASCHTLSSYMVPTDHGYSTEMYPETVGKYKYPDGAAWRQMFRERTYCDPSLEQKLLVPETPQGRDSSDMNGCS